MDLLPPVHGMQWKGPKPEEDWIVTQDAHEAIVSRKDFDDVQALRKSRCKLEVPPTQVASAYGLSGLLEHDVCGAKLVVDRAQSASGKRYAYYNCASRRFKATTSCEGIRIRADQLEPFIVDRVYNKLLSDEMIEKLFRSFEKIQARAGSH